MAANTRQNFLVSFAKTLAIIPPIGAAAGAALYFWVKSHDSVLSPESLGSTTNRDPAALDLTLSQTAGGVMKWMLVSAALAWALAALFVVVAALQRPSGGRMERGMRWVWLLFLILTLVLLSAMAWVSFGQNGLGFDLNSGFYVPVAAVAVAVLTGLYWLTTLFATPDHMGPSVPLHEKMPRFTGRRTS